MANTTEIKNRIKSVKDTRKITSAMYLISSTKMRKAKNDLDKTRPYFKALQLEIERIFTSVNDVDSRYFYDDDNPPKRGLSDAVLVVTADKGLAGAYNINAIRKAEEIVKKHPETRLFVVGEYGRHYFAHHKVNIEKSFLYTAQNPTMARAREISAELLELYDNGEIDSIHVIYTDLKNSVIEETIEREILPFHVKHFASSRKTGGVEVFEASESDVKQDLALHPVSPTLEFIPSVNEVLDGLIQSYVSGFIYSALVDSFCSEQNARMQAMSSANDNAEQILDELQIEYNRVRQAAITQEITEVSSGAKAQRKKRRKEAEK